MTIGIGDKVRVIAETEQRGGAGEVGAEWIVRDIYIPEDGDPDKPIELEPWAEGDYNGGYGNATSPVSRLRVVLTAEQMAKRQLPTWDSIFQEVQASVGAMEGDGWYTDYVEDIGGVGVRSMHVQGETDEGLKFSFVVDVHIRRPDHDRD